MENLDIKALLLNIKDDISLIKKGVINDNLLNDVESNFYDLIELLQLFLISKRDVYYGYFMMNMTFKVNFFSESIAGIKLNTYPPVFETNPLLLCEFSLNEILYIICHEIEHIILNHPAEMVKINPHKIPEIYKKFNIAADASVNDRINKEIKEMSYKFMSQPSGIITSYSIKKMFNLKSIKHNESYIYYYNLIKDNEIDVSTNQPQIILDEINNSGKNGNGNRTDNQNNDSDDKNDDGTRTDNQNNDSGDKNDDGTITNDNQKNGTNDQNGDEPKTSNNLGNVLDHEWDNDDSDYEEINENIKEFINNSSNMINADSRGLMPSSFLEEIDKINQPAIITWQSLLKKYVGTINAGTRKTKMRLNRRQPQRFDLSGKVSDKTFKIVVALDTSASVSNDDISKIFTEIFAIISKRNYEMTIIECDAKIQRVYKVRKPSDVQLKVAGRGGTSFSPVIEYINNDKYFRDALLIYFTDGFGESKIPKPLTYRNLWVILGNESDLSLNEPYGKVIAMHLYDLIYDEVLLDEQ